MRQNEIITYCCDLLKIGQFKDYCPNGLQVEGDNREVERIALGVSISIEFIEKAINARADLILTHHGLLWNRDSTVIQGPYKHKILLLLTSGLALGAFHLPLDHHPQLGNNIQLAQHLGLKNISDIIWNGNYAEGVMGETDQTDISSFTKHLESRLERTPLVLPFGKTHFSRVAIVTGGAQDYFLKAIAAQADCFITGEVSERNFAMSQEHHIHYVSAGHYATEKFGIQALGRHLTEVHGVRCTFIETHNPI